MLGYRVGDGRGDGRGIPSSPSTRVVGLARYPLAWLGGECEWKEENGIRKLLDEGRRLFYRKDAVSKLMHLTGCKDKAAYAALKLYGRFASLLQEDRKAIGMR